MSLYKHSKKNPDHKIEVPNLVDSEATSTNSDPKVISSSSRRIIHKESAKGTKSKIVLEKIKTISCN